MQSADVTLLPPKEDGATSVHLSTLSARVHSRLSLYIAGLRDPIVVSDCATLVHPLCPHVDSISVSIASDSSISSLASGH